MKSQAKIAGMIRPRILLALLSALMIPPAQAAGFLATLSEIQLLQGRVGASTFTQGAFLTPFSGSTVYTGAASWTPSLAVFPKGTVTLELGAAIPRDSTGALFALGIAGAGFRYQFSEKVSAELGPVITYWSSTGGFLAGARAEGSYTLKVPFIRWIQRAYASYSLLLGQPMIHSFGVGVGFAFGTGNKNE